jgi:hypothetical protein
MDAALFVVWEPGEGIEPSKPSVASARPLPLWHPGTLEAVVRLKPG